MSKLILPAQINPPRLRKDGSASLSFDTRELNAEEYLMIMGFRNSEGWLCFAPNQGEIEIPEERAELDEKTPSERLRNVLYVYYQQETDKGNFVGMYESFRREKMEQIIQFIKNKLDQ